MKIYNQHIPVSHFLKIAQLVPEQSLNETVRIYEDAIPYIKCEIQSTIQHESGHRKDEENRNESIILEKQRIPAQWSRAAQVVPFDQFTDKSRVEPIAEKEEENCESLLPTQLSSTITEININQLFEDAKSAAKIDPRYKQDIRAGHLPPEAQGMYLMQDFSGLSSDDLVRVKESRGNAHLDIENNLWVDVRKIISPFIVEGKMQETKPPTYQGQSDGSVTPDIPGVSQVPPNVVPSAPSSQGVQGVPGRESI